MSDRYEIQEKIGQGGIGAVYRAYDTQLKRSVAIKRMLPTEEDVAGGATPAELILKEATTLSALQHPNIITVYDIGLDEEGAFVVMELLKGETLDQVVQRGVLTMRDFCEVVSQTMEALMAAEAVGVLHRDLKPTNVMVNWLPSKKFQVKILDFSLAKFSSTPAPQTIDQGDAIFGSIYFMAPEQFERGNLDKRTDLYSMGCLYYYCLTGQYPFQGDSAAQVMASHLQGTVIPLEQIRADLPPVTCQWVMWLVNRYSNDRPQDSKEAFENFQQLADPIDPITNSVSLSGLKAASPLNTTSRRLIVPPPHKTTAVMPLPGGEGADQGKVDYQTLVTAAVTAMPRPESRLLYWWIALGVVVLAAAGLGVAAMAKRGVQHEAVTKLEALAAENPPTGTPQDIPLIVGFLDYSSPIAVTPAKNLLLHLEEENGRKEAINGAIVLALANAKTANAQEALIEAIDYRTILSAEELLVEMTQPDREVRVSSKAYHALGAGGIGRDYAFKGILKHFHGGPGSEVALQAIADRVDQVKATDLVVDVLEDKKGIPSYALMRVLGSLGTPRAFDSLKQLLDQSGNDPAIRRDRMAVLRAFEEWPGRSQELATLLEGAMEGDEARYALETYSSLLLKPGEAPTNESLIQELELRLLNDDIDLGKARNAFLQALSQLTSDYNTALVTAERLLLSKALPPVNKKELLRLFPILAEPELAPETDRGSDPELEPKTD
ncbi:MAG: protein kinase [Verrucomicrobiaceae bacterium]|nr:protein kinase [Verrucomicrobiaceae bacterium]